MTGSSSLQLEFGLGQAVAVESVEIFWPVSGERNTYRELALDSVVRIREGSEEIETLDRPHFTFAPQGSQPAAGH